MLKAAKEQKRIAVTAARLCTEELAALHATIDVMDLGKLHRAASASLLSGRSQDDARSAIREWINEHRADRTLPDRQPAILTLTAESQIAREVQTITTDYNRITDTIDALKDR